jgi:ubiquinone/menaquinone biosynthesis C-methylase UbiE
VTEPDFSEHYKKKKFFDILFRWVDRKKLRILKNDLDGKKIKILDFGCGTADITSKIEGCEVWGLDNNRKLLVMAKKSGIMTIYGDFEKMPLKDNSFDVIVSIDTIEHVRSREKTINEIKRVLKPDGSLYIFTPNYSSPLWVVAEKTVNFLTGRPSGHLSPFIKESLNYYMRKNFRTVSKVKTINFSLGLYIRASKKK